MLRDERQAVRYVMQHGLARCAPHLRQGDGHDGDGHRGESRRNQVERHRCSEAEVARDAADDGDGHRRDHRREHPRSVPDSLVEGGREHELSPLDERGPDHAAGGLVQRRGDADEERRDEDMPDLDPFHQHERRQNHNDDSREALAEKDEASRV